MLPSPLPAVRADLHARPVLPLDGPAPVERDFALDDGLTRDWSEVVTFTVSLATTLTETQASRVLYGPFDIDVLTATQTGSDARNLRIGISVADDNTEGASALGVLQTIFTHRLTDATPVSEGASPATGSMLLLPIGYRHLGAIARLNVIIENQTAATISVTGAITITHLRRRRHA
jgi:hypothetical protein